MEERESPGRQVLSERLRMRLLTSFHLGRLEAGAKLPSVRELSREWGVDPRRVMRAYHELAEDGLVEVRDRSGAYLAIATLPGPDYVSPGTVGWLTGLGMESWTRRVSLPDLVGLVERCFRGPTACILVESAEDPMEGLAAELEADFGFTVTRVWAEPDVDIGAGEPIPSPRVQTAFRDAGADLVVATSFHTRSGTALAERLGIPLVVLAIHPEWIQGLKSVLERSGLTILGTAPGSEARFRRILEAEGDPRFQFQAVPDADAAQRALEAAPGPVYATRAVRDLLGTGSETVRPAAPLLGPDSARRLVSTVIRLSLSRSAGPEGPTTGAKDGDRRAG